MANILWTRTQDAESTKVRHLLQRNDIQFEERDLSKGKWSVGQLKEAIPGASEVPQLVLNDVVIGDYQAIMSNPDLKVTKEKFDASVKKFIKSTR